MINTSQPPPLTYKDLRRMPADLLRHELIGGVHYMSPAPELKHQGIVVNFVRILSVFVRTHRLGKILVAPVDVLFTDIDVVEPDVLFVASASSGRMRKRYVAGAPDLVIEVLSPSTRSVDLTKKHRLYEAHGVPEYWIVDPVAEALEVHRAATPGGPWALAASLSRAAGDVLRTPCLPGLEIPLADVFD